MITIPVKQPTQVISPANTKFVGNFKKWLGTTDTAGIVKDNRVTCSPMVLSYDGIVAGVTSEIIVGRVLERYPPPWMSLGDRRAS